MNTSKIDTVLLALSKSQFRSSFHLGEKETEIMEQRGMDVIRTHAEEFIADRLAPAEPMNDGRQTPFHSHPVFIAQHATATCCRGCIFKWHHIVKGRELSKEERTYIVDVIMTWLRTELSN